MTKKSTIFALVKMVDRQEYADVFVRGELFMNSLAYFRTYTDANGEVRGDQYEGISAIFQPEQIGEIQIGNIRIPPEMLASPIVVLDEDIANAHVFCMYALNSRGFDTVSTETLLDLRRVLEVHRSCYGLGQVAVIVTNVSLFLERVDRAVRTTTDLRGSCRGLIDYFDDAHHHGPFESKVGFHKRKQYEKQREYSRPS